ncbi:ABC transporter substrate-binding protein [Streptococcus sp. zg-JUN1979]|uniref:ABC transporter substrate-binding protein n=1 Tax=Streptococcus sp. zg-JUN1979 TaxID=3391450 RepID=UPI0039B07373
MTKRYYYGLGGLVLLFLGLAVFIYRWQEQHVTVLRVGYYAGSSWDVPNRTKNQVLDRAIKQFEAQHPKVKVVYESGIQKEDYSDWLADQIVQGKQPDVFIVPQDDFSLLDSIGALKSLDDKLSSQLTEPFYPVALSLGNYQGSYFALPFEANPMMMSVNKTLLDKEGIDLPTDNWTLEDFYRICQQVTKDTDGDGLIDQYGITGYHWQDALKAYGGSLFDEQHQINLVTPEMTSALTFMAKLEALSGKIQVTSEDFDQGKVAFYPLSLAQYRTYMPYPYHVAKYSQFSWTCIPMPAAKPSINATSVEASLFAISSKSKHPSLAFELLTLLTSSKAIQQELVKESSGMSVLKDVMASQTTASLLAQEDIEVGLGITPQTLTHLMTGAKEEANQKLSKGTFERIDYLLQKAIGQESLDTNLQHIQKELSE